MIGLVSNGYGEDAIAASIAQAWVAQTEAGSVAVASWQRRCHRCEAGASGLAAVLPAGIAVSGGGGPLHCDRTGAAVPQHCDRLRNNSHQTDQ